MLFTAATMCSDQPVAPAAPHQIAWPRVPRSWSIVATVATREDHGVSWHVVWWDTSPLISLGYHASCLVEDSCPQLVPWGALCPLLHLYSSSS